MMWGKWGYGVHAKRFGEGSLNIRQSGNDKYLLMSALTYSQINSMDINALDKTKFSTNIHEIVID
jgi:hypothetical protein